MELEYKELEYKELKYKELKYKEQDLGWGGWAGGSWSDRTHTFATGWVSRIIHWDSSGLGGRLAIQAAATSGGALSVWNIKGEVCYFRRMVL